MTRTGSNSQKPLDEVRAEAAAWIARLHGPQRSEDLERGLRQWLSEDPRHAQIFERVTDAWEAATSATQFNFPRLPEAPPACSRFEPVTWARAAIVVLVLGLGAFGAWSTWTTPDYRTAVGEQRTIRLEDGTRISLNSKSSVSVDYRPEARRVRLDGGEVFFEVARDPSRPFMVTAGDRKVIALGTSFAVRYEPDRFAVTLVEGKVSVSLKDEQVAEVSPNTLATKSEVVAAEPKPVILRPGERLTQVASREASVDQPRVAAVTAWRRGEIVMDDSMTLADAVAEMRRYDKTDLIVDQEEVARLRVSGVYRIGDTRAFANSVAAMYDLRVEETDGAIHIRSDRPDSRK